MTDKLLPVKEAIARTLDEPLAPGDEFYTFDQAGAYTGVSRATIRRMALRGELPTYANGFRKQPKFVRKSDLDAQMRARVA